MKKFLQRILALSCFALACFSPATGHTAGWVDDWISQKTYNPPNYYQGQQRGYYSGGSFSARWPSSADYPITIEPPRLRSGCGGIDAFLGGFSFLGTDYLADKLQAILMETAASYLDMALKTVCEPCASTIKSLDALANQLNAIQLDECKAAQGVRAILDDGSGGFASMETVSGRLSTALKENKISQGDSDLYQSITEADRANQNQPQPGDVEQAVSGCNNDLKNVFLSNLTGQRSWLLHNIGVDKMGLSESYVNLIRGLVGDVVIESKDKAFHVSYVSPCPENSPDDITAFIDGNVLAKNRNGTCSVISDSNRDLVNYVQNQMTAVANRMKNKTVPSPQEIAFIESSPFSLGLTIRTAISTGQEEVVIGTMSDLTARAYVVMMLSDLYSRGGFILEKAKEMLAKKSVAETGQDAERCMAEIFADNVDSEVKGMLDRINRLRHSARSSYNSAVTEANAILQLMQFQEEVDNAVRSEVSRLYGQDVARRVMN